MLTILIILATAITSIIAFRKSSLQERLQLDPRQILAEKEWYRLFSVSLVHGSWGHLIFNLLSFYSFAVLLEKNNGSLALFQIYGSSLLGASLLTTWLHRHHEYAGVGASGGIGGLILASIFIYPDTAIGFILLPIFIPGAVFAFFYLLITAVLIFRNSGRVAHDAHFGGAVTGLLLAWLYAPQQIREHLWLYLGFLIGCLAVLWILVFHPYLFAFKRFSIGTAPYQPSERFQRYDEAKKRKEERQEIDRILDKISAKGIDSLSRKERKLLEDSSKKL